MNEKCIGAVRLNGQAVSIRLGTYLANDAVALMLVCEDGESYGTLTVCIPSVTLGPDELLVKTWSENAAMRIPMLSCGLFEDTGVRIPTGMAHAEVWRFTEQAKALLT